MGYGSNDWNAGYSAGKREEKNRRNAANYNKILDELHNLYYDLLDGRDVRDRLKKFCEKQLDK